MKNSLLQNCVFGLLIMIHLYMAMLSGVVMVNVMEFISSLRWVFWGHMFVIYLIMVSVGAVLVGVFVLGYKLLKFLQKKYPNVFPDYIF